MFGRTWTWYSHRDFPNQPLDGVEMAVPGGPGSAMRPKLHLASGSVVSHDSNSRRISPSPLFAAHISSVWPCFPSRASSSVPPSNKSRITPMWFLLAARYSAVSPVFVL